MIPRKIPPDVGLLLTLGWSMALWITGGTLLGRWIDVRFSLQPWGLVAGALAGIAISGYTIAGVLRRLDDQKKG
jgi:hypothetical protein